MATILANLSDRPMKQPIIAARTGIPLRAVQEAVQQLVLDGHPVCSGQTGHWLARDADEAERDATRLEGRIIHQVARVRAQRANAARMRAREDGTLWSRSA